MQIFLDQAPFNIDLKGLDTLEQVLLHCEKKALDGEDADCMLQIVINGQDIVNIDRQALGQLQLKDIERIELNSFSKAQLVQQGLVQAKQQIKPLQTLVEQICEHIHGNLKQKAMSQIAEFAQEFMQIVQIMNLSTQIFQIDLKTLPFAESSLDDFFVTLTTFLSETKEAMREDDLVALADLFEYEISPRLDQLQQALDLLNNAVQHK